MPPMTCVRFDVTMEKPTANHQALLSEARLNSITEDVSAFT